ncbi:MAG: hypothetical protein MI919_27540 [Holophagales bacterium]|nr:hypothetical protein [Holophagales bacterium]
MAMQTVEHRDCSRWGGAVAVGIVAVGYAVLNAYCVLAPFVPGLLTLVSWGIVLPGSFLFGSWITLSRQPRLPRRARWTVGLFVTVAYLGMSFATLRTILGIWAAI